MSKRGITLPNGGSFDLERIKACNFGHYLALNGQGPELVKCPGERYLRLYLPEFRTETAAFWRETLTLWARKGFKHIIPWNEANIWRDGGFPESKQFDQPTLKAAYADAARVYLSLLPLAAELGIVLHFPAFAPSVWYQEFSDLWAPAASKAPVIDVHAYGSWDDIKAVLDWYAARFPGKALCLTEFNNLKPGGPTRWDWGEYSREILRIYDECEKRPEVLAAVGFTWRWVNPDTALDTSLDWEGKDIENLLKVTEVRKEGTEYQGILPVSLLGNMALEDARGLVPTDYPAIPHTEKRLIIVHHTATAPSVTLEAIHRAHSAYGGFGYNVLVTPGGRALYAGEWNTVRAGAAQLPEDRLNRIAYHVCLAGDFTATNPPTTQLRTARRVIAELQQALGWWVPVAPHGLFNAGSKWDTACPGETWPEWWGEILRKVGD